MSSQFLSKEFMDSVNEKYKTPGELAEGVNALIETQIMELQKSGMEVPSRWELICYSAFLLFYATAELELNADMEKVLKWIHTVHYNHSEDLYGPESNRPSAPPKLTLIKENGNGGV